MSLRKLENIKLSAKPEALKFGVSKEMRDKWRNLTAKAGSVSLAAASLAAKEPAQVEIDILDAIGYDYWTGGGCTAASVKEKLKKAAGAPILLHLNSPGGDAFEGVAIYNLLREHPAKVTVRVIGLAASAASVIAMAGDTIEIGEGASIMIHSAWGVVVGNQADMTQFAEMLAALDDAIASVYSRRSGVKKDEVLEMMQKETWMFGDAAVDKGFADSLIDMPKKAKASASAQRSFSQRSDVVLLAASRNQQRPVVQLSAGAGAPGATGSTSTTMRGNSTMKTIKEQIAAFEAKHGANAARMSEIMAKAGEAGSTLDEAQTTEYDTLKSENAQITAHLGRLKEHEASVVLTATDLPNAAAVQLPNAAAGGADPSAARGGARADSIISVRSNVAKGIAFSRYVKSLAMARGNVMQALQIARSNKEWRDTTPQVEKVLMAAVEGGDTTTAGWASELVYNQNLVNEFIELLRPLTIIGRIPNLTMVPFNVRMSGQDSGSSAYWVGQGAPVPVSKLHTMEVTLGIAKAAGLVVLTEELVRSSAPSAELVVRNDMLKAIQQFLDVQFVDPNVAAVANVSPASITNGVTPIVPSGTNAAALRADVQTLFKEFIASNLDPTMAVWIMETTQALAVSMMLNPLGQKEFPGISMKGGEFEGLPVVTSMSANIPGSPNSGKMIILAKADDIMMADDGGLTVDASREASIQMLDNPTNNAAAGTPTTMVSMFQTNSVAIKAVRFINWKKRRSTAVSYIKEANYSG